MMTEQYLREGTLLQGGKYRIVSKLGQGGFGITYLAAMQSSVTGNLGGLSVDVPVTVKEFFIRDLCMRDAESSFVSVPSLGSREQVDRYRQKFVKEAHNIAKLNHPHIVKVVDVFQENGTEYYVMQYLTGGSLQNYMKKHGPMPEPLALKYVSQIGDALNYMHTKYHLCHLDVKPGNILLEQNNAILIDFGISKGYDDHGNETSNTPVGISEGYAPAEQYHNSLRDFSPETDVYSLGATLLALLTAQTPPNANVVSEMGLGGQPPFISNGTWSAIVAAMQPRRRDRPQSMATFLDMLNNPQDSVPVNGGDLKTVSVQGEVTVVVPPSKQMNSEAQQPRVPSQQLPHANHVYRQDIPEYKPAEKRGISWLPIIAVLAVLLMIAGGFIAYNLDKKRPARDSFEEEYFDVDSEEVVADDMLTADSTAGADTAVYAKEDNEETPYVSSTSEPLDFFEEWGIGSYDYAEALFTDSRIANRIRSLVGDTYFNYMKTHNDVVTPLTKTVSGNSIIYSGSGGMQHAATWGYDFEYEEYGSGANSLRITITDEDDCQHHFSD